MISRPLSSERGGMLDNSTKCIQRGAMCDNFTNNCTNSRTKIDKSDNKSDTAKSDTEASIKSVNETNKLASLKRSQPRQNDEKNKLIRRSDRLKNRPPVSYNEDNLYNYLLGAQFIHNISIPISYEGIKSRADRIQWEKAISEEINSLLTNKIWIFVPSLHGGA